MKAFTLYQPWASLVMVGAKPFEFRGWNPRERGPGYAKLIGERIVIHAAARPMVADEIREIVDNLQFGGANAAQTCLNVEEALDLLMPLYHFKRPTGLPLSAGLGTAVLGEPRNGHDIAVEEFGFPREAVDELPGLPGFDSDRREHANWGWPMTDIERWETPMPMRGFQGFWNWPTPAGGGTVTAGSPCPVKGCPRHAKPKQLMCWPHWRRVPRALNYAVFDAYRFEGVGSDGYRQARDAAIAAVEAKEAEEAPC